MGVSICHHQGHWFAYSSIVDAPITYGLTADELREWWRDEYGRRDMAHLETRMERALEYGTDHIRREDLADLIRMNRAGFKGTNLTLDQMIQIYCVERRSAVEGEGVVPPWLLGEND